MVPCGKAGGGTPQQDDGQTHTAGPRLQAQGDQAWWAGDSCCSCPRWPPDAELRVLTQRVSISPCVCSPFPQVLTLTMGEHVFEAGSHFNLHLLYVVPRMPFLPHSFDSFPHSLVCSFDNSPAFPGKLPDRQEHVGSDMHFSSQTSCCLFTPITPLISFTTRCNSVKLVPLSDLASGLVIATQAS